MQDSDTKPSRAIIPQLFAPQEARIDKKYIRTNDRIRAREVRVIDDEGKQVGIMPLSWRHTPTGKASPSP